MYWNSEGIFDQIADLLKFNGSRNILKTIVESSQTLTVETAIMPIYVAVSSLNTPNTLYTPNTLICMMTNQVRAY